MPRSSWMAAALVGAKICRRCGLGPIGKGSGLFLDPWDVVGLPTTASVWSVPGCMGHTASFPSLSGRSPLLSHGRRNSGAVSLCLDWFAHDRRRGHLLVIQWLVSGDGRNVDCWWYKEPFLKWRGEWLHRKKQVYILLCGVPAQR